MKILFSDNTIWGLLNFRRGVIERFIFIGYDVVLVAPCDKMYNLEEIPKGARYIPIQMDRTGVDPYSDLLYSIQLWKIYSSERPDCVFHYTIKPNIYGSIICRILRIRSWSIIAGLGYVFSNNSISNKIARWLYRIALKYPDKVFVLNEDNAKTLVSKGFVCNDRIVLLQGGEGVDLFKYRQTRCPHNKRIRFLMISRLLYEKGYNEYVTVAKQLRDQADFYIMGAVDSNPAGVPLSVIQQDVEAEVIHYIQFSRDVMAYINQADCVVLPSYHEGLSRVLMEALAIGRPIICSDIPGCRETVVEGKNGFLCKARSVMSLRHSCEKFLSLSYEERVLMGKESRKLAEQVFDEQIVINKFCQLLL